MTVYANLSAVPPAVVLKVGDDEFVLFSRVVLSPISPVVDKRAARLQWGAAPVNHADKYHCSHAEGGAGSVEALLLDPRNQGGRDERGLVKPLESMDEFRRVWADPALIDDFDWDAARLG